MKHFKKTLIASCLGITLSAVSLTAMADNWPTKPINVIVPYTPGGATDTVTRIVMQKLSERLGQTIVIENKPGANSTIGVAQAARAPNDGYHFVSVLPAYSINFSLYDLNYKASDFAPVSHIADLPLFLFVAKDIPVNSVAELVEYAKENPLTYGSSGTGSSAHMTGAYFAQTTGLDLLHIPYRGSAPILSDLLSNRVSMVFDPILVPMPHVKEDKLKVLGVASAERYATEPDVPTFVEQGFDGFIMNSWTSLLAPAGTPEHIIERVANEIAEIVKEQDVIDRFYQVGFVPVGGSPADLSAILERDGKLYEGIIKQAGIKLN
ncbi:MAG TPA: tripartite tricarboxylate transporter substrate binding protein [Oligella sp.]|nr:tripartite tricarboxylate transporter substrate binding protein [Oligella sp.]